MFSRRRIKYHAQVLGMSYEDLKSQLDPLSKSFRDRYMAGDWRGCVEVVKLQNRLLRLCPVESVQDDSLENVVVMTVIKIVSPSLFQLIIEKYLS
jgi:hypothetical protein